MKNEKVRVTDLSRMKSSGMPITMLTAYDFPFARIFDQAGVDALLVGDSLGMVVQGVDSTLPVTLEELRSWGTSRLARYKLPTVLHVVDGLPRNASGKVVKTTLREQFG